MKRFAIVALCLVASVAIGRVFVDGQQARKIQYAAAAASWKDAFTNANILAVWGDAGPTNVWDELNNNDAFSTVGVSVVSGVYSFDGSVGEEFRTNMTAMADLNAAFTVMAWVKPSADPVSINGIIECYNGPGLSGWGLLGNMYEGFGLVKSNFCFETGDSYARQMWQTDSLTLKPGTWTHVAVVVTNEESTSVGVHFVLDGNAANTTDWGGAPNNVAVVWSTADYFKIGFSEHGNEGWKGNIAYPIVVGRALDTNEIQYLMNQSDPR